MPRYFRAFLGILIWTSLAAAQIVPGRYVVELSGAPLGAEVRMKGRAALSSRRAQITSEQARVRPLIERRGGRVLSTVDSLMNALIVTIDDQQAAAMASMPGVRKVYPVYEYHADLDHALPIHQVIDAWSRIGGEDKAGAGIKIGILDTGITPGHPGFQDAALKPPAGYPLSSSAANAALTNNKIIVARSYEDIYQETDPDDATDRNGHGTAVAMCAAGVTNKGTYATITGVAPKAWIGGYKIVAANSGSASGDVILKAMDDALADGMDVINLSFGSPFQYSQGPDYLPGVAVSRLTQYGIIFVTSAGNSGPGRNTMGDYASEPSAISVGAIQNDRYFSGSVSIAGGAPYVALPGNGPNPTTPISATVFDVSTLDPTGFACSPLPAGSAAGQIALILRGVCTFEAKLVNAQAGGAVAAILYTDAARPVALYPAVGAATLPAVLVSYQNGAAIKDLITKSPASQATIIFDGVSQAESPNLLASFTSRGPNADFTIKPDLVAVGQDVYTAAQSVNDQGEIYAKDGYALLNGTSFASPIVAGAAAVLRGARPGLNVDQYRSLLINGASPLFRSSDGAIEDVQQAGTGVMNLMNSLESTVTAFPTSLTWGVGSGTLGGAKTGDYDQLTLTNVGTSPETFVVYAIGYDVAPPLQFSVNPGDDAPASTLSLTLNAGQSKTLYAYWTTGNALPTGQYQGQVVVAGSKAPNGILVPYWYGVPNGVPASLFILSSVPTQANVGTAVNLYVRVVDSIGYPVTSTASLGFKSSVVAGGGTITLSPNLYYPNLRVIQLTLGKTAGTNTFAFSFGSLAPTQISITGVTPGSAIPNARPLRTSPRTALQ
jgi:minor extracellular serine protease Vpr